MQRIIAWVTHRDSDLYLLLVLSGITFVLQLFGGNVILTLSAAMLCSFSVSILRLRRSIGSLGEGRSGLSAVFLETAPPDVAARIERASSLCLVGVSLDRTVRNVLGSLERYLQSGHTLRVVVVNPERLDLIEVADRRAPFPHGVDQRRSHILFSIDSLAKLAGRTGGKVEIGLIDDPLTFGAVMIDSEPAGKDPWILVQHYSYKKIYAQEANPIFWLTEADGIWFKGYREEIGNLYRDAKPYSLPTGHEGSG